MRNLHRALVCLAAALCAWTAVAARSAQPAKAPVDVASIDAVFARWTPATPGCAVGIAEDGTPTFGKGYGSADLEHDVPITPESIFEAGSVSKQFTAAAVLLLAREGKLSIDDPVRKYIPELPEYGQPLLIRHMLNHTSGLRDWGSVAAIAGWPRTTRVHTQAHVLDIVKRQKTLNFAPGTRWSYSNTGFNLAAIIVSRVSGQSFPEFTKERIFTPLRMTHTSWRDDYTRIVKGRAIAYDEIDGVYHQDMPFEDVYGNGGLLTTVGDLLKWNENFTRPVVGDAAFVAEQQQPGKFNDGRTHGYAFGLYVGAHAGLREVSHSGSTAGYSAFLTRYPDERVSVAVLCNVATDATKIAHDVSDVYLAGRLKPSAPPKAARTLSNADAEKIAGLYRNRLTGVPLTITFENGALRAGRFGDLIPSAGARFTTTGEQTWNFGAKGTLDVIDGFGTLDSYERVAAWTPVAHDLERYVGSYISDDAEAELSAKVEDGHLVLKRRPDATLALTPQYLDAFRTPSLGLVIFRRAASGAITGLSVVQDRVWNMPFRRVSDATQARK
ncbi:MAG TPA: serine hydrolase domain-containing protein [Vicinamibacterales bacterium]|jgi:CubicO group peptidase (beta-lactamase class C family)